MNNKRRVQNPSLNIITVILILMCSFLVSCSPEKTEFGEEPVSVDESVIEEVETPSSHGVADAAIRVTGNLHDGMRFERGAKTKKGYYTIIGWPSDMMPEDHGARWYGNIVYIDYGTCQQVYLCNVPGCSHNTPDCTSFVSYLTGALLCTDYSEEHLYLISEGSYYKDLSNGDLPCIIEMNMDGSDRRTVCTLASTEIFSDRPIIASDDYIYVPIEHLALVDGRYKGQEDVERIWIKTGEREKVFSLKNNDEARETMLSTWGEQELLIRKRDWKEDKQYLVRVKQNGEIVDSYDVTGTIMYYNDQFILTGEEDGKTARATATDYSRGESWEVEDIPANTPQPGCIFLFQRYKTKVNWHFLDKDEKANHYIVDFETGSVDRFTLTREYGRDNSIVIIADAGNDYLVVSGEKNSTITLIDQEGISHKYPYDMRPVYALISKEDYWNCVPNYRYVDDLIE